VEHSAETSFIAPRIHVISTPIPSVRLLKSMEGKLKELYDSLLDEPVPEQMLDLILRHERADEDRRAQR
jgi:hypothetical protein